MSDKKIDALRLRYIVPFSFQLNEDETYDELYMKLSSRSKWIDTGARCLQAEQDLYSYLIKQFEHSSAKNNIGTSWIFNKENDTKLPTIAYVDDSKDLYIPIQIINMGLYIFRSNVGFLWYEVNIKKKSLTANELIYLQSILKELARRSNMSKFYLVVNKSIIYDIQGLDFKEENDIRNSNIKEYKKCHMRDSYIYLHNSLLPQLPENIEYGFNYKLVGNASTQKLLCCGCKKFLLGDWIATILSDFPSKIVYFSDKKNSIALTRNNSLVERIPDKALLFNYIVLTEDFVNNDFSTNNILETAYYLTSGYNENYIYTDNLETQMYHPFRNLYWNITKEGCGCYVLASNKNKEFFITGMKARVINDYFLLYILLLHQSYALLNFADIIEGLLPAEESEYRNENATYYCGIEKIISSVNTFFLKNVYASVSHIQHQNDFYEYGLRKLHVKDDIQSVILGIDALADIQYRKQQKAQEEKEKKEIALHEIETEKEKIEENSLTIGLGLLSLFAVISALNDSYTLIHTILSTDYSEGINWLSEWMYIISYVTIGLIGIIALVRLVAALINQHRLKKKLKKKEHNEEL